MYNKVDYIKRGLRLVNNVARPGHKKLSTVMIYATDLCDSACKHCQIWTKRPVKYLPYAKIVEIMQSKCISKSTVVGLEGGEFLLHPEAEKILSWFAQHHPNFDLLSNCLKPQKVIDAVEKYTPGRLFVSLDGDRNTYQYMRGKDGYDRVLEVIEHCKDKVPISAMFTLSPYNDFQDMDHVVKVCQSYGIDVRIGVYNDIDFFDTIEKAHRTEVGAMKATIQPALRHESIQNTKIQPFKENSLQGYTQKQFEKRANFQKLIPTSVKETEENLDFLLLYDEWRKQNTKLKCYSILDSVVIHPNGDVPICQNLNVKLGNVFEKSLDEVFNSVASQKTQNTYKHNCNQCWINFHRKYDIVMLRTLEKFFPKRIIELIYGKYQWCFDAQLNYQDYMKKHRA